MQMTILKKSQQDYKKGLLLKLGLCIGMLVVMLIINICLSVLRTDELHKVFLGINISIDLIVLWTVFAIVDIILIPENRRYHLYKRNTNGEKITGVIKEIEGTQRVLKMNCYTIGIYANEKIRKLFIIEKTFENAFQIGDIVSFILVDNIAVECEVSYEK